LLALRHGQRLKRGREKALVAETRLGGGLLVLAVPLTYMNDSGLSVVALVRRYGIEDMTRLVIVHDELDLPLGRIQVKAGGGLKAHLKTDAFTRVRIGIGKPPGGRDRGADHVLRAPSRRDRTELDVSIELAADAVEIVVDDGVLGAQNRFNG
jgi:PTH1 family peptidyl-tRNA hydrolase